MLLYRCYSIDETLFLSNCFPFSYIELNLIITQCHSKPSIFNNLHKLSLADCKDCIFSILFNYFFYFKFNQHSGEKVRKCKTCNLKNLIKMLGLLNIRPIC